MDAVVRMGALVGLPALSPEREHALARAAQRGDGAARDDLVRASLRLVALRVLALNVPAADRDDAFQSGVLGLMSAIDRFDPDRGARLASYAWPWISAAIRSSLREQAASSGGRVEPESAPDDLIDPDVRRDLGFLLAGLPALVAEVMRLRFGFGDGTGEVRSRATVATRLGLTVSEVRTVEANTLASLRRGLARLGHRAPGRYASGADPL
jgi:RNA polymerase sigma factor (sigma-70 family)